MAKRNSTNLPLVVVDSLSEHAVNQLTEALVPRVLNMLKSRGWILCRHYGSDGDWAVSLGKSTLPIVVGYDPFSVLIAAWNKAGTRR